jgi:mannose PTS system EIID component
MNWNEKMTTTVQIPRSSDDASEIDIIEPPVDVPTLTKHDHYNMYFRSTFLLGSYNFERMQAMGFAVTMMPAIKRFYPAKNDRRDALKRHLEFFNTTPWLASSIIGVTAAMERERARGGDIDDGAISAVKVGLMGPMAGVGDPIVWGTIRPVLGALGASFALSRSFMGPIIFFLGMGVFRVLMRWYGQTAGYTQGTALVSDMGGGQLHRITKGASILGLFVMGCLVNKWTSIHFPMIISQYKDTAGKEVTQTMQGVLDSLLPGLAALGLTFLCMFLLRRGVNAMWIIFGMFAVGILGFHFGILGL